MTQELQGIVIGTETDLSVSEHLTLEPGLPPDRHPAYVYLARMAGTSRRTQGQALGVVASMLIPDATVETCPWHRLRYQHVQAVRTLLAEKYAPATSNRMLAALRGTIRQAFLLGLMPAEDYQRCQHVESVRGSRLPRGRSLSAGELRSLFLTCDGATPSGARNAALLAVLYGGGLRRREAALLELEHYNIPDGTLKVLGKGNKQRSVPLPPGSRRAVDAWLVHRGNRPGPLLCPILKNGHVQFRMITGQSIREALQRLTHETGGDNFSPHDLRRTYVSDMLDAGSDLSVVQQLVGHSSPTTTSRYDRRGAHARRKAADLLHVPFVAGAMR